MCGEKPSNTAPKSWRASQLVDGQLHQKGVLHVSDAPRAAFYVRGRVMEVRRYINSQVLEMEDGRPVVKVLFGLHVVGHRVPRGQQQLEGAMRPRDTDAVEHIVHVVFSFRGMVTKGMVTKALYLMR